MTELIVKNVHKWLGGLHILKGVNFTAQAGSIVALLGGSGSGKTTLLRCIAGLEQPETGFIEIGGAICRDSEKNIELPPEQRHIGLVFQSYALWPHRTVRQNVAYGLKLRGVSDADCIKRVNDILDRMGLSHLADRYPAQLSGGQQQRVAICRALVYEPRVLLLDEPLSNLDAKLREEARYWIRKLILDLGICAILVTHDQTEALAAADRILLLQNGQIVQEGTPREIYSNPNCFYSADFLGANNIIEAKVKSVQNEVITFGDDTWELKGYLRSDNKVNVGDTIKAVIRVEQLQITKKASSDSLTIHLEDSLYLGDRWEYRLKHGNLSLKANGTDIYESGEVFLQLSPEHVWVFGETLKAKS